MTRKPRQSESGLYSECGCCGLKVEITGLNVEFAKKDKHALVKAYENIAGVFTCVQV